MGVVLLHNIIDEEGRLVILRGTLNLMEVLIVDKYGSPTNKLAFGIKFMHIYD